MLAFTVPFFVFVLMTSEFLHAHPAVIGVETISHEQQHPAAPRFKRGYAVLQRHDSNNNNNDDLATSNLEESLSLPYLYSVVQRANRKRLIDF